MNKLTEEEILTRLEEWRNTTRTELRNLWVKRDERAYKKIVELIKIFFAKEISSGPIKEDISRPVLIEWLQGINQAATSVHDDYVMKATMQLIGMVADPEVTEEWVEKKAKDLYERISFLNPGLPIYSFLAMARTFIRSLFGEMPTRSKGWLPTAENINALPEPVRNYIAGLETNADPPSMVAENIIMKDTIKTLEKICEERPAVDEGFVNTWAKEFGPATLYNRELHKKVKDMLREAGVEVIKI